MENGTDRHKLRIEALKEKERELRALRAAEQMKLAKRDKRETEKLDRLLGGAVRKTGAVRWIFGA